MTNTNKLPLATNYLFWKLCAWAGPICLVGSALSWGWLGHFVPPPQADWGTQEVVNFFSEHSLRIRTGMVLAICFMCFYWVWSASISRLMREVEGPNGSLATVELVGGMSTAAITIAALVLWTTAAFRPEARLPTEVLLLNDLAWIVIDTTFMGTVLQNCALAFVFLSDARKQPLIPGWVCWLSIAVAAVDFMAGLIPFFMTGPFSWHGLISFWVVFGVFFIWIAVVSYYLIKAIHRLQQEEAFPDKAYPSVKAY